MDQRFGGKVERVGVVSMTEKGHHFFDGKKGDSVIYRTGWHQP